MGQPEETVLSQSFQSAPRHAITRTLFVVVENPNFLFPFFSLFTLSLVTRESFEWLSRASYTYTNFPCCRDYFLFPNVTRLHAVLFGEYLLSLLSNFLSQTVCSC